MWWLAIPLGYVVVRTYQGKSLVPDFIRDRFTPAAPPQTSLPPVTQVQVAKIASPKLKSMVSTYKTASLALVDPLLPDDMKTALQNQLSQMRSQILTQARFEGVTVSV